jgi:hypothetical protein
VDLAVLIQLTLGVCVAAFNNKYSASNKNDCQEKIPLIRT